MKLTIKEKRFLIIWGCFHLFALFVNVANIRGDITTDTALGDQGVHIKKHYYLFTSSDSFTTDSFWPFITFIRLKEDSLLITTENGKRADETEFYGIFNSYNYTAFIAYAILGLMIVYIPKLWKSN